MLSVVGTIQGTAGYMAPEQARGKPVDKRADIWAFGVVLHEMLTGNRLFQGEDLVETLAAVVHKEPDLSGVPEKVRPLLKRCLEKDPIKRLRDITGMEFLLDSAPVQPAAPVPVHAASAAFRLALIAAGVFAVVAAAVSFIHFRETQPAAQTTRYSIVLPENSSVHSFAISPDGRKLAIAASVNGKRQLWLRPMDAPQAQPMPSTEDATYPFWSPDSRNIGFFA
jgi:eukaryotic-like serine/threonine-protein kinase